MGVRAALLALGLLGVAAPAAAQTVPDLRCRGNRPDPGCDAARVRRQREVYDMAPAEQLRDEGMEVRRVFFSQAFEWSEWDIGALVFERRPGHGPTVRYQPPRGGDGILPEPLVADLSLEAWREAQISAEDIERQFVPSDDGRNVCLFGRDYVVEIATPREEGESPPYLYRRVENACYNPSPAQTYVLGLARIAERFFPACAFLRFRNTDGDAEGRLAVCATLQGDRLAAAEAHNAILPFFDFSNASQAPRLAAAFDIDAELDWNGTRISGRDAAAEHWARSVTAPIARDFHLLSIRGETEGRVRVEGALEQEERLANNQICVRRAAVEMIWIRRGNAGLLIRRATVGASEPFVPDRLPRAMRRTPSPCAAPPSRSGTEPEPAAPPSR